MTRLLLMRHGVTDWNAEHRLQGRTDRRLTEDARLHLAKLVVPEALAGYALCSSPLSRARHTARLVFGQEPLVVEALIEKDLGSFEGQRGEDLLADPNSGFRHIEDWGWDYCPHGGESPRDVVKRLRPWLAGLSAPVIAVAHMGVLRVLLAEAYGYDFKGAPPFRIKRDRLYPVSIIDGRAVNPEDEIRLRPAP